MKRFFAVVLFVFGVLATMVPVARAATIDVPCGDVAALRSAITTANGTPEADTINVTSAPCNFNVTDVAVPAASGNTAFPAIVQPLTIEGNGATVQRAPSAPTMRLFLASTPDFVAVTPFTVRDLTITGGLLTGGTHNGAGIAGFVADITLENVIFTANATVGRGGAIGVAGGSLDATRSVFVSNAAGLGSAIYTNGTASSNDIRRSAAYFNAVTANSTVLIENGTAAIENSTVAANAAPNGLAGVTAFTSSAPPAIIDIRSSTLGDNSVSGNTAPGTSLLTAGNGATINVTGTVVADTDSQAAPVSAPCQGNVVPGGGNVEWPTTTCNFEVEANPNLAYRFAGLNNLELFAKPQASSAAIDAGGADCPTVDQRGASRPAGLACDSGSWETQPPDTTADGPDSPTNDPAITFSSDVEGSTFVCSIDGGEPDACTLPFEPDLGDGEHTVEVSAISPDGDVDPTPASVTFVVDTTAPDVTITDAPSSPTEESVATIAFTVSDVHETTTTCSVDAGDPTDCTSPFTTDTLDNGEHTVTVVATDAAGNEGSDSVTFVVDNPVPDTEITGGPSGQIHDASTTFSFTSIDPEATFECRLDGGDWSDCTSPHPVSGYANGAHTFEVRAIDGDGDIDPTPASRSFTFRRCILIKLTLGLFGPPFTICI